MTTFKSLKWQVGMTFGSVEKFKEVIIRFTFANRYNLRHAISDYNNIVHKLCTREHLNLGCMPYDIKGEHHRW